MDLLNFYVVQMINRGVFVLFAGMLLLVARNTILEMRTHGVERYRLRGAVSLLLLFSGEVIKTGTIVWVRFLGDNHLPPDLIARHQNHLLLTAGALLFYGAMHFIKVWAPEEWGHLPWIAAGVCTIAAALL